MAHVVNLRKFYFTAACLFALFLKSHCDIDKLYSTINKTTDLKWTSIGWEEVSGFNQITRQPVRTYQVCKSAEADQDNWLRTTYIPARAGLRLHIELEFSIMKCDVKPLNSAKYCRETFNLFYYENDKDVASSTFPPWKETPYEKVDTVAANSEGRVNNKTFTVGPLRRNGLYIAIQDQGACMSINGLRVYYYFCPEKVAKLARFPKTNAGGESTSLVQRQGQCVPNAQVTNGERPKYHCNSDGKWKILTGGCQCDPGYKRNRDSTICQPCAPGTFKADAGDDDCIVCPANSGPIASNNATTVSISGLDFCPCLSGYFRSQNEAKTVPCTKPPTKPRAVTSSSNATGATLRWRLPAVLGGRDDITYSVTCQICRTSQFLSCVSCTPNAIISTPKVTETGGSASVSGLKPYTQYIFKVYAKNGVSKLSDDAPAYEEVKVFTSEAAPSSIRSIFLSGKTDRTLEIKWRPPQEANGVTRKYEIEIRRGDVTSPQTKKLPILKESTSTTASIKDLEPNTKYVIRIRAGNSVGFGAYSESYEFQTLADVAAVPQSSDGSGANTTVIIVVVIAILVIVLVGGALYYRCRGKVTSLHGNKNKSIQNGHAAREQESLIGSRIYVEYPDPNQAVKNMNKEISPENLTVLSVVIGEGEFAEVLHGNLLSGGETQQVAVKQLKHGASVKDQSNFLREACSMAQFDHPNILQLKGVITRSRPMMIVSEYMQNGSLDEYLRKRQGELQQSQLAGMLQGIASGMAYLSKMKYVHRDLAARNILVNSDFICKVSDFGLSRTLENDPHELYMTQGGKIAIRWAAPECIRYRQFTSASDVWSYGIVMWEVMSYGEKPYWDMTNQQVVQNIEGGMRLPAPTDCPKSLHDKMLDCWSSDPNKRPKFGDLAADLDTFVKSLSTNGVIPQNNSSSALAAACATPNLQNALIHGEITNVEEWLKVQKLDKYKERFLSRGLDTLEKVSDLTIKDLRTLGIDVTLHVHKLENGIRSLRRHLSTSSSRPTSAYSADDLEPGDDDVMLPSSNTPNGNHVRPVRNGSIRRPETINETEALIPEGSVEV